MAENLAEAESFALYFSGSRASSSTPHLYISALATWPRKSSPCWEWKSRFPRIPGFTNALLGGTLLMTLNMNSAVYTVAVSPDGKHIVAGSYDNSVRVWDASTGSELKELNGHTNLVTSVVFSPDGNHIISGSYNNLAQVWDSRSLYIRERIVDSGTDRHGQYTGWLLSPHSSIRLMFMPLEALLPDASNILTIPYSARRPHTCVLGLSMGGESCHP